ncbi:MAG: oligosaccharide flippase family protein [Methanobacterium sp.]|jgi:O-antigen/teichoic acid export membrane protein
MKNKTSVNIEGSVLARNTVLNFIGQAVPLLIALVTIPLIIEGLGTERYGLLSLVWVVLGYFAIFDLGLGQATTKFVAEALSKGEEEQIPRLVWTAVTIEAVLGIVGALVLIGITPLLVEHILNIPPELVGEAKATFYLLAFSVPVVLVSSSFQGTLEAAQRFDLVAFVVMSLGITPQLRRYSGSFALLPRLFSFGGWATVTSIVGPILVYLDYFLIGSFMSIAAVAFYAVPYKIVTQLWIITGSLTMTIFPAFSTLEGIKNRQRLGFLFARAVKYILLALVL